jgi:hypothetical protein
MFIAVTYLLTLLSVTLLLWLARKQHRARGIDGDQFGYPAVFRYFFLLAFLFFLGAGFYSTRGGTAAHPFEGEMMLSWATAAGFCGLAIWGLLLFTRFSVTIVGTTVTVTGIVSRRSFDLRDVHEAVVLEGYRGAKDLILSDRSGHALLKVGGTIEDFEELVDLVRGGLAEYQVILRRRDALGAWH